ncbi:uncharacterized protein LOC126677802 isoform X2 [Mercurialis annua]|uniref:uncharacterized protein LOC126677802 isoform X2 n=1 Tax=Mercurialis annua TaxID=3986 RepID=UPI002160B1BC|nr:uncharacterized protein LOC126677802 isoform X2 [Mercurialis annua]
MENLKNRWSITYTKHMKQKRKIYQDGFLDHHISTNKVKLFDDCEKLLECKILKSEEVVKSGETLTFGSYLVDVGDPEGEVNFDHKKTMTKPNLNLHSMDKKIDETPRPSLILRRKKFRSPSIQNSSSVDKKDDVVERNIPVNNISPSKKMIREFKKSEVQRYEAFQSCPETVKTEETEWQVMYTTQMTQKAKKYHDGFLRLANNGSFGRQIMLYDERRELLGTRFLKKDELIRSYESIKFDAHLVDIGEPERKSRLSGDLGIQENFVNVVGKNGIKNGHQNHLEANRSKFNEKEWYVLYTSQITQKAKKYHSGILRLASCGSYRMQLTLLDEDKTILSSKFISISEDVNSGCAIVLPKYLVEVGEPHHPKDTSNSACSSKDASSNLNMSNIGTEKVQKIAQSGEGADLGRTQTNVIATTNKSLRGIHQILSILQKPIIKDSVDVVSSDKNMTEPVSSAKCQVSDTESHLDSEKANFKPCDEAFASGFSIPASDDKVKKTEQLKCEKIIDDLPTFDLGF